MRLNYARHLLLGTTSTICITMTAAPVAAQEQERDGGQFLGTLVLGESKRTVQTDTAAAVTEIDQTEIRDRQAGTVAELIDSVPGVNLVNGATPSGSGINIRGYGANGTYGTDQKVLIQIDGATKGAEELYRIGNQLFTDPFLYREVEVIRGTVGSFQYGSGVVGGVVRLETKDAADITGGETGLAFRQSLEFSSNGDGLTSSSLLAWQPTEKLGFLLGYTRRMLETQEDGSGNPINPAAGDVDDPSWLFKASYSFGESDEHSLSFSYTDTQSEAYDVPYDSFGLVAFGNVDRFTQSQTASLRYNYDPVGNDLLNLTAGLTWANEEIIQNPVAPGGSPLLDADNRYRTTTLSLGNTALFATGTVQHVLRTGIELIRRERSDAFSAPGGTDERVAIYVVDRMQVGERWTVTPALRYEHSTVRGSTPPNTGRFENDALMGGLSLRYAFGNGFAVFGSAAYTEALPIIDDVGTPANMTISEKARTYEIGASYSGLDVFVPGDVLALKANYYDTELRDVTSYVTPAFGVIDRVETTGLELEASYGMAPGLYFDVNANIARGKELQASGAQAYWRGIPADSLRLTMGKRWGEALDLSWELVANGDMDRSPTPTSDWVTHNLRATYAPQAGVFDGTEIRVGIENLFDRTYTPHLSTRPAPGRNFKLTLTRTF